ncbi:hypothetical protein GPZ77_01740 [Streptomyces sp. QHH-9511]|uniref:FG-GAP and VCBS repeat-containing protein n=1 Tax=Streptomyces sp. QHH-9511 TaxID=2684468 RepID=UPI0013165A7E|nr:FG-GAP and VCBS repeat-containing protein [Streptomyces sp. QHH-9511]QGZ47298.1 hypothetical protein GPZ77_01740 [Streptomyces sp. QHH-9511]
MRLTRRRTPWIAALLAWSAMSSMLSVPVSSAAAATAETRGPDLNGDGWADIVTSSSARLTRWRDPLRGPADLGGSVYVLPGGPTGSRPAAALLNQDSASIAGSSEQEDTFGQVVATGDFDKDGRADVALGNAHEEVGGFLDAGAVTVQYGQSAAPYVGAGKPGALTFIEQGTVDVPGDNEMGDLFGTSLATGDFNGDSFDDLAIGAPGEAVGTSFEAGRVTVLYGGANGLTAAGAQSFDGTVAGAAEPFDHFGASLAAANLRGDGRDDLAVLASGEYLTGVDGAWGAALVLKGQATGLDSVAPTVINVNHTGTTGHLRTVTAGHFQGSTYAGLAFFADQEKGAAPFSGAVVVASGGSSEVSATALTHLTSETPYADAYWGGALAAGDIDGDGTDELAVGALRGARGNGSVTLYLGDTAGLTVRPRTTFTEETLGGTGKNGEGFGYALSIQDSTGDGVAELIVGAPWEDASAAPVAQTSTVGSALYELSLSIPAGGLPTLTSYRSTTASAPSSFGPGGVGLAGGVTVLDNYGVEPSPWLDRLPPLVS